MFGILQNGLNNLKRNKMNNKKQETIEKVAEKFPKGDYKDGLIDGANWQAERMYSEIEVLQLLLRLQQTESYDNLYGWFEQFKKK
jgi:hypothetical protein